MRPDYAAAERRFAELLAATAAKTCPRCGVVGRLVLIQYGSPDPAFAPLAAAIERGQAIRGHASGRGDDPLYRCGACGRALRLDDFDAAS